jgi:TRAP-type mannitol/chloroaromatic compound transport system permease small subunit
MPKGRSLDRPFSYLEIKMARIGKFLAFIDRASDFSGLLSMLMLGCLVASMIYEVVARYVFGTPTLWAFDISYMLNGSIFLMGAGYALKADAHVRIDFLSSRMSPRKQQLLNTIVYALVLAPIFACFTYIAGVRAYKALQTSEVEMVSPWAPLMWPFYSAIALGLLFMTLQLACEAVRFARDEKKPGTTGHELQETEAL